MLGIAQVVDNNTVSNHISNLSELSDVSTKCSELSQRAISSSIQCAKSIANVNTMLKTDIHNILDIMDNMKNDFDLVSQDVTIIVSHLTKLSATLYDIQDMLKDKLKQYDENFEQMNKKLIEYGDILKETQRDIKHKEFEKSIIPTPRVPLITRHPTPKHGLSSTSKSLNVKSK